MTDLRGHADHALSGSCTVADRLVDPKAALADGLELASRGMMGELPQALAVERASRLSI